MSKQKSRKEEEEDEDDAESEEEDDDEENKFYDFHEPMKNPDILIQFEDQRMLLDVEFIPGKRLLVESSVMYQNVEVYQIEKKAETALTEPIHVIETGAHGLSAITVGTDKIWMGFRCSMEAPNVQLQAYSLDYEQVGCIALELEENIVSQILLFHNEKWLVCTHQDGYITVVNTEDMTYKTS